MSATVDLMISVLRNKLERTGELHGGTNLNETGLDSLDVINFLFTLEEETGVKIPDGDITKYSLETLNDFAEYIDKRRQG